MRAIRVPGIAQTAIFVGVCPNAMFPHTCSATRSGKIDHLLLADDCARRFLEAFYRSGRTDDIEIYPLVSNTLRITVQPPKAYFLLRDQMPGFRRRRTRSLGGLHILCISVQMQVKLCIKINRDIRMGLNDFLSLGGHLPLFL